MYVCCISSTITITDRGKSKKSFKSSLITKKYIPTMRTDGQTDRHGKKSSLKGALTMCDRVKFQ